MFQQSKFPRKEDTTLELNRSGVWEIRWSEYSETKGRFISRTFSCRTRDRNAADIVRDAWLTAGHAAQAQVGEPTLEMVFRHYKEKVVAGQMKGPTQFWSFVPIEAWLRDTGRIDARVSDVTAQDLVGLYTAHRRGAGIKDSTIRRELGAWSAAMKFAKTKTKYLPPDVDLPYVPLPPVTQPRNSYLSRADADKLFDECYDIIRRELYALKPLPRPELFICIALETAARARSIETLDWSQVDVPRKVIDFNVVGRRVTKKRRAVVPISNKLFPVLCFVWNVANNPTTGPVLGHKGSTQKSCLARLKKYGVTRHDLRRTWATLKAQAGAPLFDIAGVLGDDIGTVTKNYAHHHPDALRKTMDTP